MAGINDLLEEAIKYTLDVYNAANGMAGVFGGVQGCETDLIQRFDELAEVIQTLGGDCVHRFEALSQTLQHAQHDLVDANQQALQRLHTVHDQVPAVASAARQVETHARELAHALDEAREKGHAELEAGRNQLHQDAAHALTAVEGLATLAQGRLAASQQALSQLRDTVSHGRTAVSTATDHLLQTMALAEDVCRRSAQLYTGAMGVFIRECANDLTNLANAMIAAHNQAFADVRHRLAEQDPKALSDLVHKAEAAFAPVVTRCQEDGPPLTTSAGDSASAAAQVEAAMLRVQSWATTTEAI